MFNIRKLGSDGQIPITKNYLGFGMKTFLHVGCGPKHKDRSTTAGFITPAWQGFAAVAAKRGEHPYYHLWALAAAHFPQ